MHDEPERLMVRHEVRIQGMGCDHCVMTVRKALEKIDGVTVNEVEIGRAGVQYDPASVSEERIDAAIHEAGYEPISHRKDRSNKS